MNEEKQKKSYSTLKKNQLRIFLIAMSIIPMITVDAIFSVFNTAYRFDTTRIIISLAVIFIILIILRKITNKILHSNFRSRKVLNRLRMVILQRKLKKIRNIAKK